MQIILVIGEHTDLRENTAELLELAGYRVITAKNAKEGVKKNTKHIPALILCDLEASVVGETEILDTIEQYNTVKKIPIVFLSSGSDEFPHLKRSKPDGYLIKPFTFEQLINTVLQYIKPK